MREKKSNLSPAISRGFAGRNSASRELKLLYATRATCGSRITRFFQGLGFHRNREKVVSWEITQIEEGFLSYSV